MEDAVPLAFHQKLFIAVPAARVWEALTSAEDVAVYHLCPLRAIQLYSGGRIEYASGDRAFITGVVREVTVGRRLVHTFRFAAETHEEVEPDGDSLVTYAISPMGSMCELTLTHDGFTADSQTFANITGGWPAILSGLKTLLETGRPLPWPTQSAR